MIKRPRILMLALLIILIFTAALFYIIKTGESVGTGNTLKDKESQLIINVVEIEKNRALAHVMKISYDELKSKTEPFIYTQYKETYFEGLKKEYETRNLMPYILDQGPPYYEYISKVYSSDDGSIKQIFTKSTDIWAINAVTHKPIEGTRSQIAKQYTFRKENGQWKILSANNYILSIDKHEPKRIIEKFTNFKDKPIEYEYIKVLE